MNKNLRRVWMFLAAATLFAMVAATPVLADRGGAELGKECRRTGNMMVLLRSRRMVD